MLVIDETTIFSTDPETSPAVRRMAEAVMEDVRLVTGARPDCVNIQEATGKVVYFGTLGESKWLEMLNGREDFDFKEVRGKREVFGFWTVVNPAKGISEALIIVGSDRLGTIYGLFHLSEVLGVSPLVRSFGVLPRRRPRVELGPWVNYASSVPSAKLRGLSVPGPVSEEDGCLLLERLLRQRGNLVEIRKAGEEDASRALPAGIAELAEDCGVTLLGQDGAADSEALLRIPTEWSRSLPELWSRMTDAFDADPEVGFLLETPVALIPEPGISFFLDLANDKKKLGGRDASVTSRYSWDWLKRQFGTTFQAKDLSRLDRVLADFGRLAERWRPEEPGKPSSAAEIRQELASCRHICDSMVSLKEIAGEDPAFFALVEEPVIRIITRIADDLEEASRTILPHRVTLSGSQSEALLWKDGLRPDCGSIPFEIAGPEGEEFSFRIQSGCPWLQFSVTEGTSSAPVRIVAAIDRSGLSGSSEGVFMVSDASGNAVSVQIPVYCPLPSDESDCFWESAEGLSMDASHAARLIPSGEGALEILAPFGPLGTAIKAFPAFADYSGKPLHSLPCAEYEFVASEAGPRKIRFLLSSACDASRVGFSLGRGPVQVASEPVFEDVCGIRAVEASMDCPAGRNLLRVYALTPGTILLRILIRRADAPAPVSCTGPAESYFHRSGDAG